MSSTIDSDDDVQRDEGAKPVVGPGLLVAAIGLALVWIAAVVVTAGAGGFVLEPGTPPWPILLAAAVPLVVFGALWRVDGLRQAILGIDPVLLVAVQLWRVIGAAFLFGWTAGELDAGFAIPAGIGDIATGLAALGVLAAVRHRSLTRSHLVGFTALGVGDFAVAVVTGAVIGPDQLEVLPWVLFPALAVPFFSMVHVINWAQLAPTTGRSKRLVEVASSPAQRRSENRPTPGPLTELGAKEPTRLVRFRRWSPKGALNS